MKSRNASRLVIDLHGCPSELRTALAEVQREFPRRFGGRRATPVTFQPGAASARGGLSVSHRPTGIEIRYGRKAEALRALGRLMGALGTPEFGRDFAETPRFDLLGVMWDVSRNAVLRPEAARSLIRRCALMGINTMMLYAEDVYEVPGEPFFGYLRGRYTAAEMRELDDYADAFGVEMFPCIQTLAHLEQVLKWPAYAHLRDTPSVLLAGDPQTYALVEKMIRAASAPFRSKRIHLGMDEAHGIGQGHYRELHGDQNPFDILNTHLARVRAICRKLGLSPMIWSDMYFRLGSKSHEYYDRQCVIPRRVANLIPKDVRLVYWDYYHTDEGFYRDWIDRHRALGSEPVMAGGVWTWNRFWAQLPFSFRATDACLRACKAKGLREVFVTMWGDDGMECDPFSALAGIQYFAEHAYADRVDQQRLRANFRGACGADFDAWVQASGLDVVPGWVRGRQRIDAQAWSLGNPATWLLWDDPLLGLTDPQWAEVPASRYYGKLADDLERRTNADGPAMRRLRFPAGVARAVALKCALRRAVMAAYRDGDRPRLQRIARQQLPAVRRAVERLWREHRRLWLDTFKPFGFEVVEARYGGLLARLDNLAERLQAYGRGEIESIPELAATRRKVWPGRRDEPPALWHRAAATASCVR